MFHQITFESRSPYRYVAHFRKPPSNLHDMDSYFSVEVHVSQNEWGTLMDENIRYSIEICKIERPDIMAFYTYKSRRFTVSGDQFVTDIGKLLVKYGVVAEGVLFQVNIELNRKVHSFMQMNAGCVYAKESTHLQTVQDLFSEFADIPVNNEDEIEQSRAHFDKGNDRFEVLKWFEESFGYPVDFLLTLEQCS